MLRSTQARRRVRALLLILFVCAIGALLAPAHASALSYSTANPNYVQFQTAAGTWRIYVRCADGAGPGYVAYASHGGRVIIDDTNAGQQDTTGGTGIRVPQGLGKFIYREARAAYKAPLSFTNNDGTGNTWYVDGRHCAGAGGYGLPAAQDTGVNPDSAYTHQIGGVTQGSDAGGAYAELRYLVTFRDRYIPNFLSVTYVWRFHESYIQMWSDVIERCSGPTLTSTTSSSATVISHGQCSYNPSGANYPDAWIKGPKYIVGIGSWTGNGTNFPGQLPYQKIRTLGAGGTVELCSYQRTGTMASGVVASDRGLGWRCPLPDKIKADTWASDCGTPTVDDYCWSGRPDPRAWVQFQPPGGVCTPDCFNAVFRAYAPDEIGTYYPSAHNNNEAGISPGASALNWMSTSEWFGMDQWAQNMDLQGPQNWTPCVDPVSGNTSQRTPYSYKDSRVWESLGDKYTSSQPYYVSDSANNWTTKADNYTFAGNYFFAWRDCFNVQDDPLIYRAPEGYDTNYGTYATFSFTTNNSPPPAVNG